MTTDERRDFQCVVFDCMDTLIRMDIRTMDVYADWAFAGADGLDLWNDIASFRADWRDQRDRLLEGGDHREGTVIDRIRAILERRIEAQSPGWTGADRDAHAERMHAAFWERYRKASYVLPEVPETLDSLANGSGRTLLVASNFMVPGGIPELLALHRLDRYFEGVVVSCDVGWRKPSERMYRAVIEAAGRPPEDILFVGDSVAPDYDGPRRQGMTSVLYDPDGAHPEIPHRIRSFPELQAWL